MRTILFFLFNVLLFTGCFNEKLGPAGSGIEGTWRLYERGSSPGSGYYTYPVPAQPLQSLTFSKKGEVNIQGDNLNAMFKASYYHVTTDQNELKINFFTDKKKGSESTYMRLEIVGDTMHIRPYCIEGCHYSFVRIP